ncbi:MAG: hypothetical protein CMF49_02600 [Legionellales bacterium]|nr:hypothetical protein [Legionellales bacterium]
MSFSINDIKKEIAKGESKNIEFKKGLGQIRPAMKTLCAFLNNSGGKVFFGVTDNAELCGLDIADKTKREIAEHLSKLEPHSDTEVQYIEFGKHNKFIILLIAKPHSLSRPYSYDGTPYYREESTTRQMPQRLYQRLIHDRTMKSHPWDEDFVQNGSIENIDSEKLKKYISISLSKGRLPQQFESLKFKEEILMRLGLIEQDKLVNAAIVLFGGKFLPSYPQCCIKLALFNSDSKRDIVTSEQLHGNFFDLLREAELFIKRNTNISTKFVDGKMDREDTPDYPAMAIRELLINALAHRNDASSSGYISVEIYPGRLEIASFGRLPDGILLEDLQQRHRSVPVNKLIADLLYKAGFIETFGTGTQEVSNICERLNRPLPIFSEEYGFFIATLYKSYSDLISQKFSQLSKRRQNILGFVAQNKDGVSNKEILKFLENSISDKTLSRDLQELNQVGALRSDGEAKAKKWYASI